MSQDWKEEKVAEFMRGTWRTKLERWTSPAGKGHTLAYIEIALRDALTAAEQRGYERGVAERVRNARETMVIEQAIAAQERKRIEGIIEGMRKPNREHPCYVRVAEAIGVSPTTKGPIAQARKDGWITALSDLLQAIATKKV